MKNMTIKCTVCGLEEILDDENLEELSVLVKKYKMSADSYTYLLNKMRGKCLDSDEHLFIFDEEFMKQIQDIVDKNKLLLEETEKTEKENETLLKELKTIQEKSREIEMKILNNNNKMDDLYENGIKNIEELKEITKNINIDIWK